ncbi:MAG: reverse transcriptase domain-containing protein [Verrucomicrobiales bacterium]
MKTEIESWEDLDFETIEAQIFHIQKGIFRASKLNDYERMHHAQLRLVQSFRARAFAVYLAAERSEGGKTAGVDGAKNLSDKQKLKLAQSLRLTKKPDPVRRVNIPKPGSQDTRPLGIPTIADRALQHLIKLALEPEWEARFSRSTYGFRKGRSCHDALVNIRANIRQSPKWVLDGDIEKFFDRLDHRALLKKLHTFSAMEKAIHRVLKAGWMEGEVFNPTTMGTPQGGPLSPLLANIALCGLEDDLLQAFPSTRVIDGERIGTQLRLIVYADDFVCLHPSRAVVEETSHFISKWLLQLGLNLSPTKSRVAHTLHKVDGQRGFDFLGCEIRQHRVGKHQGSAYGIYTHIGPSRKSQKRIYAECAAIIDNMVHSKKRNGSQANREAKGQASQQEILIYKLNSKLRGWAGYHRHHNSKRVFSTLDHKLFKKLFCWTKRRHPKWRNKRRLDHYFNRADPWIFKVRHADPEKPVELLRVDSTPIQRHIPVKSLESFHDGDWAYWGKRSGYYPGVPSSVTRCLKRQTGKCRHCNKGITSEHRVLLQWVSADDGKKRWMRVVHQDCGLQTTDYLTWDPYPGKGRSPGAQCGESRTLGSGKPKCREAQGNHLSAD